MRGKGISSRALRRMAKRAVQQVDSGKAKVKHLSKSEILERDGLRSVATFVPITKSEWDKMETYIRMRLKACRNASKDKEAWLALWSALMEAWVLSRGINLDDITPVRQEIRAAANALDVAIHHFETNGEVLQTNIDIVEGVIELMLDMRKLFGRKELLDAMDVIETQKDTLTETMLGRKPKFSVNYV